jgi:hypothetical protein
MRSRKTAATSAPASLPLFERSTRSALAMLIVRRLEDGRWLRAPKPIAPGELPDRETVRARFGGGKYEIIGRDAHRIVARTTFVLEGQPIPFAGGVDAIRADAARSGVGERAFGTETGARQALVYALLDQGLSCIEVTQRTAIDDDIVRDIYLRWLTPDGGARPTTVDEIALLQRQRAAVRRDQLRAEWERA